MERKTDNTIKLNPSGFKITSILKIKARVATPLSLPYSLPDAHSLLLQGSLNPIRIIYSFVSPQNKTPPSSPPPPPLLLFLPLLHCPFSPPPYFLILVHPRLEKAKKEEEEEKEDEEEEKEAEQVSSGSANKKLLHSLSANFEWRPFNFCLFSLLSICRTTL